MKAAHLILILMLTASLVYSQQETPTRVIQFRVAADDPAATFSFKDWSVMGKFDGEIHVFEKATREITMHILLERGELLAPKSSRRIVSVTPFLSEKNGKSFKPVAGSTTPMKVGELIGANVPYALQEHKFVIEVPKNANLANYWLTFEISFYCDGHPRCTTYAHSHRRIFAK